MYQSTILHSRFYNNSFLQNTLVCLFGIVFLALAAHLVIPLQPVPLTFQSAAVILIGMTMGPRLAAATLSGYLVAGFLGLPVFASGGIPGPTLGYLIGFLPAAIFSGWLAQQGFAKNIALSFIASILGATIIFALGLPVLATFIGWKAAIAAGLMPFIITEPLKLFAISLIIPRLWKPAA
ncbi:MAG: biotin transporter BioY [Gammaproteobacteria bacterium]|nr:biotin transporter BioY [Gammaproteobacteria bacterium]